MFTPAAPLHSFAMRLKQGSLWLVLFVTFCEATASSGFAQTNYALQFNGTSQYVTFGAAPGLGAPTFTLECWFKWTGGGATASTGTGGIIAIPLVTKGRGEAENSNVDMNYFLGIASGKLAADFEELPGGRIIRLRERPRLPRTCGTMPLRLTMALRGSCIWMAMSMQLRRLEVTCLGTTAFNTRRLLQR